MNALQIEGKILQLDVQRKLAHIAEIEASLVTQRIELEDTRLRLDDYNNRVPAEFRLPQPDAPPNHEDSICDPPPAWWTKSILDGWQFKDQADGVTVTTPAGTTYAGVPASLAAYIQAVITAGVIWRERAQASGKTYPVMTINEARAQQGKPPLVDPSLAGNATVIDKEAFFRP